MSSLGLDELMRYERGDLPAPETERIRNALTDDVQARQWLEWLSALRSAASAGGHFGPGGNGPSDLAPLDEALDPHAIASLALGELSEEDSVRVRRELSAIPHGYELLESALEEAELLKPASPSIVGPALIDPPSPAGNERHARWAPVIPWLAAAALLLGSGLWLWGDRGPSPQRAEQPASTSIADLAERAEMPVPTLRTSTVMAGFDAYRRKAYAEAATTLRTALDAGATEHLAWLYLGSSHLLLEQDDEAIDALQKARERCAPSYVIEATWQLAQAYLGKGDLEAARDQLRSLKGTRRAGDAERKLDEIALRKP